MEFYDFRDQFSSSESQIRLNIVELLLIIKYIKFAKKFFYTITTDNGKYAGGGI